MSEAQKKFSGPDFTQGVALTAIEVGAILLGHAHGERALTARRGAEVEFERTIEATRQSSASYPGSMARNSVHASALS